jgi:hypothetical protein
MKKITRWTVAMVLLSTVILIFVSCQKEVIHEHAEDEIATTSARSGPLFVLTAIASLTSLCSFQTLLQADST